MASRTFESIKLGETTQITRRITEEDVIQFSKVTHNNNPVHFDANYAETTRFKERIANGLLVASLVASLVGNELPGENSIYLKQEMIYLAPVYFGDYLTATLKVTLIDPNKRQITLESKIENQHRVTVLKGVELIYLE